MGQFLIDGCREIEAAARCGVSIRTLFATQSSALSLSSGLRSNVVLVGERIAERISYGQRKDTPVAIAETPNVAFQADMLQGVILVLDRTEKPGNLGACLRTADAAGVTTVILTDPVCEVFNDNAIRASRGAIFSLNIAQMSQHHFLVECAKAKMPIFTARVDGEKTLWELDLASNAAVVFGNEAEGLGQNWLHEQVQSFTIPMSPSETDSLNLSISAAVTLFEAKRQRTQI